MLLQQLLLRRRGRRSTMLSIPMRIRSMLQPGQLTSACWRSKSARSRPRMTLSKKNKLWPLMTRGSGSRSRSRSSRSGRDATCSLWRQPAASEHTVVGHPPTCLPRATGAPSIVTGGSNSQRRCSRDDFGLLAPTRSSTRLHPSEGLRSPAGQLPDAAPGGPPAQERPVPGSGPATPALLTSRGVLRVMSTYRLPPGLQCH
jgi:hypothetical protein